MTYNGKTKRIRELTKQQLIDLIEISHSLAGMLRNLGVDARSCYYKVLRERLEHFHLDPQFAKRGNNFGNAKKLDEILVENSTYCNRACLKRRLIKAGLVEYKCITCGLGPEWNGYPISLQLDHINGVNTDNRLKNLRILCPNCHSQTETYSSKCQKKKECKKDERKECKCGKLIRLESNMCNFCSSQNHATRRFEVSKEELERLVFEDKLSYVQIGKKFGVSDNAIRKRSNILGVPIRKKSKPLH